MRGWLKKLGVMAAATAFAEEGEWETALNVLNRRGKMPVQRRNERLRQPGKRVRDQLYRV